MPPHDPDSNTSLRIPLNVLDPPIHNLRIRIVRLDAPAVHNPLEVLLGLLKDEGTLDDSPQSPAVGQGRRTRYRDTEGGGGVFNKMAEEGEKRGCVGAEVDNSDGNAIVDRVTEGGKRAATRDDLRVPEALFGIIDDAAEWSKDLDTICCPRKFDSRSIWR